MRYAKYKPTGIAWLPEVPEEWEIRRLKYVATSMRKGNGITKEDVFDDGDLPCVRYGEIYSKYDISFDQCLSKTKKALLASPQYFSNGDILFSCTGELVDEIGKNVVYCGDGKCAAGGDIIVISHEQDPRFLNYYLGSYPSQRQKSFGKAKLKVVHIHALDIQNIVTLLPPYKEQRAIVAFLDEKCGKVDRLVAAKEKEVALLKELKQSMIAEAVTRGISHAESAEGAERDSSPRSLRSPRENNRRLDPSGIPWLPEVPEGWNVQRLASLFCDDVKPNKDFAYTKAMKFNYGTLVPKNEIGEPEDYRDVYVKYSVLQKNDIVINGLNLNYDFNSLRVAYSPCGGIITSAYIVCRPRDGVESAYFTYLFKAMDYRKMFHGMGTGIRLTLSFNELRGQMLPVPPLAEQREIVAQIEAKAAKIDAAVAGLEREIAALKEYKQRLIADVVTGQRRVA